jgi:hypothetical protein
MHYQLEVECLSLALGEFNVEAGYDTQTGGILDRNRSSMDSNYFGCTVRPDLKGSEPNLALHVWVIAVLPVDGDSICQFAGLKNARGQTRPQSRWY